MKTVTNTVSAAYHCDGCSTTVTSAAMPPSGWKSFQVMQQPVVASKMMQNVDLCATCAASGNASGIAALAKLLN